MRKSRAFAWTVALLACSALLAAVIAAQVRLGPPPADTLEQAIATPESADVSTLANTMFSLPPVEEFREIVERPLFDPSRRPYEPPPPPEKPAPAVPPVSYTAPRLSLLGIAITPEGRSALFLDQTRRQFIRAGEGMDVAGWELSQITPEGVVLSQGAHRHKIELLPD